MFLPPKNPETPVKGRGEYKSLHSYSTKEEKSRHYDLLRSLSKLETELKGSRSLDNSQLPGQNESFPTDQITRSKTNKPQLKSLNRTVVNSLVTIGKAMEASKSSYDVSGVRTFPE